MKYIFLVCVITMLGVSALADLVQCDQVAAGGMTYILASSSTTDQGIIISQDNSKGGLQTLITTKAKTTNNKGVVSWVVPVPSVDWNLPAHKSACYVFVGASFFLAIDNGHGDLEQNKPVTGHLQQRAIFEQNPSMAPCRAPEAFPAPPTRLTCHTL